MKNQSLIRFPAIILCLFTFYHCNDKKPENRAGTDSVNSSVNESFNGYESKAKWGEHLVLVAGCNDCHTPKKMTTLGPVLDTARWLSGHPAEMPQIDIDRKDVQMKGLAVTSDLTEWIGPWGVSYTANLTPDPTGIGNWTEEQFFTAIREGKSKGIPGARTLLPPMPWEMYRYMTDAELSAVFAYLRSIKPINNLVPAPIAPGI